MIVTWARFYQVETKWGDCEDLGREGMYLEIYINNKALCFFVLVLENSKEHGLNRIKELKQIKQNKQIEPL